MFATLSRCRKMLDLLCAYIVARILKPGRDGNPSFGIPSVQPRVANETGIENIFPRWV